MLDEDRLRYRFITSMRRGRQQCFTISMLLRARMVKQKMDRPEKCSQNPEEQIPYKPKDYGLSYDGKGDVVSNDL